MNNNNQNQECCPEFMPQKWDKKEFHWDNKNSSRILCRLFSICRSRRPSAKNNPDVDRGGKQRRGRSG